MRHVSTADLHANAVGLNAAIRAGDEVSVSLDGTAYRLVADADLIGPDDQATIERRGKALETLREFRASLRAQGVRVTPGEIRGWIDDGRP